MRKRHVSVVIPESVFSDLEYLKDQLQQRDFRVLPTRRQVIGRDGIALATICKLLHEPLEVQIANVRHGLNMLELRTLEETAMREKNN